MARVDAVRVAAQARREALAAMDRLERYIATGNRRGIAREVRFLNALNRQAMRVADNFAGRRRRIFPEGRGLGEQLLSDLRRADPHARSSFLATFSDNVLAGARQVEGDWVWVANQTACAGCMIRHGSRHDARDHFNPLHPSCLCYPETRADAEVNGVRNLTDDEVRSFMRARGDARSVRLAQRWIEGAITREAIEAVYSREPLR